MMMMSEKSTERFSNRVEDYVKYRPHYPTEIMAMLRERYHVDKDKLIADIGAGTGISSELFLKAGFRVTGIEPNREMREKAAFLLQDYTNFTVLDGTAENTGLPDASVDVIIAGQAFHWFDRQLAKKEFKRTLKKGGLVLLIWNERLARSVFEKQYEALIVRHGNNYLKVDHRNIHFEDIQVFFAPGSVSLTTFENCQIFDFEGLKGRLLSSSYMPGVNDPGYTAMVGDLRALFDRYQKGGTIRIDYETNVYAGRF